ncbi:MAG: hypothetical protein RR651_04320 [Lysinibacillus sp.]
MMSLSEVKFSTAVRKQVKWKLRSFSQALLTLIFLQLFFTMLTMDSTSSFGTSNSFFELSIKSFTLDLILIITCIWGLITGLLISTKAYRFDDLAIVASRTTSSVANSIVLVIFSAFGTFTIFAAFYIQVARLSLFGDKAIIYETHSMTLDTILFCFSLLLLSTAIGYVIPISFSSFRNGVGLLLAALVCVRIIRYLFRQSTGTTTFMAISSPGMLAMIFSVCSLILLALATLAVSKSEVLR